MLLIAGLPGLKGASKTNTLMTSTHGNQEMDMSMLRTKGALQLNYGSSVTVMADCGNLQEV